MPYKNQTSIVFRRETKELLDSYRPEMMSWDDFLYKLLLISKNKLEEEEKLSEQSEFGS